MPEDQILKEAFEIADDGMQAAVGYFYYVVACQHLAKEEIIIDYLQQISVLKKGAADVIPITHEWGRYYDPLELVQAMRSVFLPYHIRTCLLGIVSIFDAYLSNSIHHLVQERKMSAIANNYKKHLEWAFPFVLDSTCESAEMRNRRPKLCLDIDHARRIRNLWMHKNGNFDQGYEGAIKIESYDPIIVPEYEHFLKSPKSKVPFPFDMKLFENISRSHIEALHHIYNTMQMRYFGHKQPYDYRREKKAIRWSRFMLGV